MRHNMKLLRWIVVGVVVIAIARQLDRRSPRPQHDFAEKLDEALDELFPGRDPAREFASPDVAEAIPRG
jgi:hypothetical protein